MPTARRADAFTFIELLVVVAVIAILIGILLPTLGKARASAQAVQCSANLRTVAQGCASYTSDSQLFPPSYVYGSKTEGSGWALKDQQTTNPTPANGYIHWSWSLFNSEGGLGEDAFTCPATLNGGAPPTNPGSKNAADWESWQQNELGQTAGAERPRDRQAKRVAFTGNAAIFPRNKFTASPGQRLNKLVNPAVISGPSRVILATEFCDAENWQSLSDGLLIKSHRPISPFLGRSAGADVYAEPNFGNQPRYEYPDVSALLKKSQQGSGLINDGNTQLNAIGRHHPGETSHFAFVDGHVERLTVKETIQKRLWGEKFYSLTGANTGVYQPPHSTN